MVNGITAFITRDSYASKGQNLCTSDILRNKDALTGTDEKAKYNKCFTWCKNNLEECGPVITETCQSIYDQHINFPDIPAFQELITEYRDLCACNWPEEFYQSVIEDYKTNFNVSESQVSGKRECLYKPCREIDIKPVREEDRTSRPCDPTTYISCIQELTVDLRGAMISGDTDIINAQQQKCGSLTDTGAAAGSGEGGADGGSGGSGEGGGSDEGLDKNKRIIIVIVVIIILVLLVYGFDLI